MEYVQARICKKFHKSGSRYPFLAKKGSSNSQDSQFPVERPGMTEVGNWELVNRLNELKGKLESRLSEELYPAVRRSQG